MWQAVVLINMKLSGLYRLSNSLVLAIFHLSNLFFMHTRFGTFPKRFSYIRSIFAGKLGWNDNDLFVGMERDIDVVSVINDSSISTFCYGAKAYVSLFL
jgi:hypothetical protein